MEAHESEMYRMEREAQKINNEQEKLKQDKLNELRNKFESDINEAIKREQEQVNIKIIIKKLDVSSRLRPNWGSIMTTTIGKTHPIGFIY